MTKKRILFVTFNGIVDAPFGGAKVSIRNYESLNKVAEVFPYQIQKHSNIKSTISLIQGYLPPILNSDIDKIKNIIKREEVDFIFYDSSLMGEIQKEINLPNVIFCHNCEKDYFEVRFGKENSLKKSIYKSHILDNEMEAVKRANCICALTERDSQSLFGYYNRCPDVIIPLSIKDYFNELKKDEYKCSSSCLLFGPAGMANNEAFTWFIKNVSPYLNCHTVIAGKGMETLKPNGSDKVEVIGFVESPQDLYASVDCVAIPLLSGGGMKVKTAEALMYGKYVFGTDEAFIGYDSLFNDEKAGKLCNSADDFIREINAFMSKGHKSFNYASRKEYLNHYSIKATQHLFDQVIAKMEDVEV